MKKILFLLAIVSIGLFVVSCQEDEPTPLPVDDPAVAQLEAAVASLSTSVVDPNAIEEGFTLPTELTNDVTVAWKSSNSEVASIGEPADGSVAVSISRPHLGQADAVVTLTATVTIELVNTPGQTISQSYSVDITVLADEVVEASIMYAASDWGVSYWGEDSENASKVEVTGFGQYTVSLDLSSNPGNGFIFFDVEIKNGEIAFPYGYMQIDSIKINDTEYAYEINEADETVSLIGNYYTSSDDGVNTRTNLYNGWVSEVVEGRSKNGGYADLTAAPLDIAQFADVDINSIEVTFTLVDLTPTAAVKFASGDWNTSYWGGGSDNATEVSVTDFGQYTVGLDFSDAEKPGKGVAFLDVEISSAEFFFDYSAIQIDSILINGNEVSFELNENDEVVTLLGNYYTTSDNKMDTRVNIYNSWVSEVTEGRSMIAGLEDSTPIPLDISAFADVVIDTIEVTFTLVDITPYATLNYASSDWQVTSYDTETTVRPLVTDYGTYTTSFDISDAPGTGVAFFDVEVMYGEFYLQNSFMEILSVVINGEEVEVGSTYTSTDNGVTTRTNLYNEWVGEVEEGRTADGKFGDISAIPVDDADMATVSTVSVTFKISEGYELGYAKPLPEGGTTAYINVTNAAFDESYWYGDEASSNSDIVATTAAVTGYGQYTVSVDFTGLDDGYISDIYFLDVEVLGGEEYFPFNRLQIDEIKVNDAAVTISDYYTYSNNGTETRVNLVNSTVTEIPELARLLETSVYEDVSAIPLDLSGLGNVENIEITFTIVSGERVTGAPYELPESFTAFMMFAADGGTTGWQQYEGGTSGDAVITGDGTYTVSLSAADLGATAQAVTAQVFLIDIPEFATAMAYVGSLTEDENGDLMVTDATVTLKVYIDGVEVAVNHSNILMGDIEAKGTFRIELYNIYGTGTQDKPVVDPTLLTPTSTISVEFTISGTGLPVPAE